MTHRETVLITISILSISLFGAQLSLAQEVERPAPSTANKNKPQITPIKDVPLEKVLRISDELISGGEPKTSEALDALKSMGVKTIISVDGARPRVEQAKERGIRYVHIPIGYDGISDEEILEFLSVARQCEGPVYVHCHHGQHRAPAAATIIAKGMGYEFLRPDETDILVAAHTGVQYPGLWKCAQEAKAPESLGSLPPLPEIVEADSDVDAMTKMDRIYENLKHLSENDWKPLPDHPDITAAHEATILWESLVEWHRLDTKTRDPLFTQMAEKNIQVALEFKNSLADKNAPTAAHENLKLTKSACSACHKEYRNE